MSCRRLAVTPGEPAGIGPDLVLQIAQQDWPHQLVVIADPALMLERAALLGLPIELEPYDAKAPAQPQRAGTLTLCPVTLGAPVVPGELDEGNGAYVLATLQRACDGNLSGEFAAVVTGPVHKGIINQAGVSFSGHTEFFAQQSGTADVVMLLATEGLRVALATTHIPLAYVAMAITEDRLGKVIRILDADLKTKFGIAKPRIYVCGLNPHAGEGGHLGREEIDVIEPALAGLRQEGIDLVGPLPADTLFQDKYLKDADAVLAMYHDQGLPVLKYKGFGSSVNITLGLPFIRTSVDHGTALDLAGKGLADPGSLITAINHAIKMVEKKDMSSKVQSNKVHMGHTARKRFGQNFLHDRYVIDQIVAAINPQPGQNLVEIGPGLAALTEPVASQMDKMTVVELDRDLAARLREHPTLKDKLTVIEADAMRFDFGTLMGEGKGPLRIFGNLPYNISTPLIFHLCDFADRVEDMHFMLQKEVVLRMSAGPGSKAYGRLSVMVQYYCQVIPVLEVGPGAFKPAPKVDSAVVRLVPHKNPTIVAKDIRCLSRVCTEGFGQRRKTIRNSFANFITDAQLTELGIDGNLRPENLSLEQFVMIANWLADQQQA